MNFPKQYENIQTNWIEILKGAWLTKLIKKNKQCNQTLEQLSGQATLLEINDIQQNLTNSCQEESEDSFENGKLSPISVEAEFTAAVTSFF